MITYPPQVLSVEQAWTAKAGASRAKARIATGITNRQYLAVLLENRAVET